MKAAGFSEFPKDTAGFLELCKAMKAKGTPAGFPHGKAVGDGNNYAHWLLWSHGGKMVDEGGKVAINSPETLEAINYAKALYETFIPGTESWLDINNNRAFLAGQVSLTANGVSLYYASKKDPAMAELAADIRTTNFPIGPVGQSVELHQTSSLLLFNHTKYPEAAKAYIKFMMEADQMNAWITGLQRLLLPAAQGLRQQPGLDVRPDPRALCASASETLRPNGYAGPLGYASAGVMADYVLVDMFASAVTGQMTPEEAIVEAERRANRYYRV